MYYTSFGTSGRPRKWEENDEENEKQKDEEEEEEEEEEKAEIHREASGSIQNESRRDSQQFVYKAVYIYGQPVTQLVMLLPTHPTGRQLYSHVQAAPTDKFLNHSIDELQWTQTTVPLGYMTGIRTSTLPAGSVVWASTQPSSSLYQHPRSLSASADQVKVVFFNSTHYGEAPADPEPPPGPADPEPPPGPADPEPPPGPADSEPPPGPADPEPPPGPADPEPPPGPADPEPPPGPADPEPYVKRLVDVLGDVGQLEDVLGEVGKLVGVLGDAGQLEDVLGDVGKLVDVLGDVGKRVDVLGDAGKLVDVLGNVGELEDVLGDVGKLMDVLGDVGEGGRQAPDGLLLSSRKDQKRTVDSVSHRPR
nr:WW domain-binding protein 11-like [Procambarus clarkii]